MGHVHGIWRANGMVLPRKHVAWTLWHSMLLLPSETAHLASLCQVALSLTAGAPDWIRNDSLILNLSHQAAQCGTKAEHMQTVTRTMHTAHCCLCRAPQPCRRRQSRNLQCRAAVVRWLCLGMVQGSLHSEAEAECDTVHRSQDRLWWWWVPQEAWGRS